MSGPAAMTRAFVVAVAAALSLLAVVPASAATPCWRQVLDDWSDNGRIDAPYADTCYEQALRNLPTDVEIYSDAADVIAGAREQALREKLRRPTLRPGDEPGGGATSRKGDAGDRAGPIGAALNAGQSAVGDVPLPLLGLTGIALLLTAAGGAGLLSRRLHARRISVDGEPGDTPG